MPDHWQETTLGGIATVVSERVDPTTLSDAVYVGLEHLETDSRTLSAWGTSSDVSSSTTPFVEGDTLFGRLRPYLRKGCVAPLSGVCTPEILVVRSGASVDSRFLGLLVLNDAVFDECNRLSAGSRMPRTSATDLKGLSVLVPPFTEQRRIVDLVGSIDTYIDSLETQIDATRTARSALLAELLSNPGDLWQETTLGEVAIIRRGISYRSPELAEEGEGMPFLNLKSVARGGGYRHDGLKWFSGDYKPSQVVTPGDIVVCCTDLTKEKAILGYPLRVPDNTGHESFCISLDLAALDVDESAALSDFMFLLLQGRSMREFMKANSSGTTVMHLRMRAVPQAPVTLPPLDEQRRIVDLVGSVDEQISSLESQVESVRAFRKSVLSELLSGERLLDETYDVAVGL